MFIHCNRKFNSCEIWFLHNNKDFIKRKLYLGTCPICGACIVKLSEQRRYDGKIFKQTFYKKNAENIFHKLINQVEYTNGDIPRFKKVPTGFCYGENIEVHNKDGKVIGIKQKRCDYYGSKEVIKKFKPSYPSS